METRSSLGNLGCHSDTAQKHTFPSAVAKTEGARVRLENPQGQKRQSLILSPLNSVKPKEATMRRTLIALIILCIVVSVSLVLAKEKQQQKQMDPQAMMEVWKKLGTPGEPHKLFSTLAG